MKHQVLLHASIVMIVLVIAAGAPAADLSLPRGTPEAQGITSHAVCDFVAAADKINTLHTVKGGKEKGKSRSARSAGTLFGSPRSKGSIRRSTSAARAESISPCS